MCQDALGLLFAIILLFKLVRTPSHDAPKIHNSCMFKVAKLPARPDSNSQTIGPTSLLKGIDPTRTAPDRFMFGGKAKWELLQTSRREFPCCT
jgi:hypothetical protein